MPASQNAIQEEQFAYASTSQQHMGRGRGGFPFGQQPSGRRPYRGGGRARSSWSRTRNYQPRPSFDDLPSQGILNRVAAMQVTESHSGWDTQAVQIEAATVPQQQVEDLSSPHAVVLPPAAVDPGSVESPNRPADATEQPSVDTSESSEPETSLVLVRVDRTPSLDSETTETTSPAQSEQPEFVDFDEFVATTPTPVHPHNNAIQLQDIHFASVPNPIHPRPGQPPETICAWYTYPMPPREGVFIAPLPGLSPVSSAHPPPPPPPHPPVGHPPSHFYFTHDHAFLALCHPVPMLPYAWLPVPYLAYWGPERFGEHPTYYDVPMVSANIGKSQRTSKHKLTPSTSLCFSSPVCLGFMNITLLRCITP